MGKGEMWRDVVGYEGLYEVSDAGSIRNAHTKKIKKPYINRCGYKKVQLRKNGSSKNHYIHRLVALSFICNPDNLKEINHKDENKLNNNADNLEWCTRSYNVNYGLRIEKFRLSMRNNPSVSKEIKAYDENGLEIFSFPSASEAGRVTGIPATTIRSCAIGNLKRAGGLVWRYT
jgi:hypothetical protein